MKKDEQVFQMTDTLVDYQNATITEIVLDHEHLVALVNLSSVNRLVMVFYPVVSNKFSVKVFPVAAQVLGTGIWHSNISSSRLKQSSGL